MPFCCLTPFCDCWQLKSITVERHVHLFFSHEINGADGCRREVIEERGRGEDFTSYPLPLISFFIFLFFLRLLFDNLTREKELLRLTSSYLLGVTQESTSGQVLLSCLAHTRHSEQWILGVLSPCYAQIFYQGVCWLDVSDKIPNLTYLSSFDLAVSVSWLIVNPRPHPVIYISSQKQRLSSLIILVGYNGMLVSVRTSVGVELKQWII